MDGGAPLAITSQERARLATLVYRGDGPLARPNTESTGFPALDRLLPGGGWPVGALTELYPVSTGIGEFTLLLPLMSRLTRAGRRVVLVAPPYIPYSQALAWHGVKLDRLVLLSPEHPAEALWAMQQTLASKTVALAVGWPQHASGRDLRRLQLAAETGGASAVLYRPLAEAPRNSPAAARLRLAAVEFGLSVELFRSRGGRPATVTLQSPLITAPLPMRSAAAA